jgi:hypothetical protein
LVLAHHIREYLERQNISASRFLELSVSVDALEDRIDQIQGQVNNAPDISALEKKHNELHAQVQAMKMKRGG